MNEHEPIHVHIKRGGSKAKVILVPEILIDKNYGFKLQEMKAILEIIVENYYYIIDKCNETFNK